MRSPLPRLPATLALGCCVWFNLSTFAQSPGKVVDQYIRAAGGARALRVVTTVTLEGAIEGTNDQPGSYALILKSPNRLYSETILGGERSSEAFNGKSSWKQDSSGLRTLTGAEANALQAAARYRNGQLLNYRKEKLRLQLAEPATVHGRQAYHLTVVNAVGFRREVFFDAQSHLIVKEAAPDESAEEIVYDDYRPVSGVMEPHRMEIRGGGHVLSVSITRAAVNSLVDDSVFDFPKSSQAPLPDIPALIKDMEKNQKAIDALVEQYACRKTEEEDEVDDKGRFKQKSVKEYEVFYLGGEEIDRLVKKDGKELTPAEQQKENEHVEKRIDEFKKHQAKKTEQEARRHKEDKDDADIAMFLRVTRFVNPRRERFRGKDVIVFDFEPKPGYKPKNLTESVLQKLVGVAWVDEQARDVARLEARFSDSMKVGGGLVASIQKGSAFAFEQTMMNNEVWLPSYAEVHVSARVLLLKTLKANAIVRYTDYKKFHVESVIKPESVTPNP